MTTSPYVIYYSRTPMAEKWKFPETLQQLVTKFPTPEVGINNTYNINTALIKLVSNQIKCLWKSKKVSLPIWSCQKISKPQVHFFNHTYMLIISDLCMGWLLIIHGKIRVRPKEKSVWRNPPDPKSWSDPELFFKNLQGRFLMVFLGTTRSFCTQFHKKYARLWLHFDISAQ